MQFMKQIRCLIIFLLIGVQIKCHAQINLTAGLQLYLPFNGNALDASGNGNNATVNGPVLTIDQYGNANSAYLFDGVNDFMQISNNSNLSPNSFSISVKVKPLSFYNGVCFNNIIVAKGTSAGNGIGDIGLSYTPSLNQNASTYCTIQDSLHESYRVYAGSTGAAGSLACITPINAIPYVATNNWDCVVGTYDSATQVASVYVNGALRYSYTITSPLSINSNDIFLGKQNYPGYNYWMNAVLDEVRIYNRAINQAEIDSLCNFNSNATPTNLILSNDTSICSTSSIQINTTNALPTSFTWTPITGLNNANLFSPIASPTITTTYILNAVYNGITIVDSFTIIVLPNPTVNAGANINICQGNTAQLNGTAIGATSYQWLPSTGLSSATILNPICSASATTTYSLIATNSLGCSDTDDVIITVNPLPTTSAGTDQSFCDNTSGVSLNGSGIGTPVWTNASGLSNANILNPIASPSVTTSYTLTITSAQGCSSSDVVIITPNIAPTVSIAQVPPICYGDTVALSAIGANTYSWTPNTLSNATVSNPNAWPITSTIYTVTGTSNINCTGTSSVTITVSPAINISISGNNILCYGDTSLLIASGAINYIWQTNNATIGYSNSLSVWPTVATTYTVFGTDANNCMAFKTFDMIVDNPPLISVSKSNDIQCTVSTAQLNASGALNYAWVANPSLSSFHIPNPITSPFATTTFYVLGTNLVCTTLDSITVEVFNNNANLVRMPNAFSPNGDGVNDCFRVLSNTNFTSYSLQIYNRFGQQVFSSTDPKQCWYGEQEGREVTNLGTYFYILKGSTECSSVMKKGDVIMVK
jgi:gliding motility-associated-like protein